MNRYDKLRTLERLLTEWIDGDLNMSEDGVQEDIRNEIENKLDVFVIEHKVAPLNISAEMLSQLQQPTKLFMPSEEPTLRKPSEKQVGGGHYKKYAIQPTEFCAKNNIPFIEGNVIKYTLRHADKNGREDIDKAIHYLELLKEYKYGK